jgi:hypothetical protein
MAESDFGLSNKGGFVYEGPSPSLIDAGMPSEGSPGDGDLMSVGFAGEHMLGGPAAGYGPLS